MEGGSHKGARRGPGRAVTAVRGCDEMPSASSISSSDTNSLPPSPRAAPGAPPPACSRAEVARPAGGRAKPRSGVALEGAAPADSSPSSTARQNSEMMSVEGTRERRGVRVVGRRTARRGCSSSNRRKRSRGSSEASRASSCDGRLPPPTAPPPPPPPILPPTSPTCFEAPDDRGQRTRGTKARELAVAASTYRRHRAVGSAGAKAWHTTSRRGVVTAHVAAPSRQTSG